MTLNNGRGAPRAAYSIIEFCQSHGFSRATYYNLKAHGEGPDETHVRGRVLITEESARRWRKRRTARARQRSTQLEQQAI